MEVTWRPAWAPQVLFTFRPHLTLALLEMRSPLMKLNTIVDCTVQITDCQIVMPASKSLAKTHVQRLHVLGVREPAARDNSGSNCDREQRPASDDVDFDKISPIDTWLPRSSEDCVKSTF